MFLKHYDATNRKHSCICAHIFRQNYQVWYHIAQIEAMGRHYRLQHQLKAWIIPQVPHVLLCQLFTWTCVSCLHTHAGLKNPTSIY